MKKRIVFFVVLISIFGCDKSRESMAQAETVNISLPEKNKTSNNYEDTETVLDSAAVATDEPVEKNSNDKTIEPQIIKNANLSFETSDLSSTYNQVSVAVKKFNGIVQSDSEGKNEESLFRNLTIRIPSKNFDAFLSDATTGVNYFDEKEITSTDVTEEYVDVISRIKTKKVLEERYLELLKKATKVSEMLEIEAQISAIREEIEAKEGRLKFIKNRVSQSTINLRFYKIVASESGETKSFGNKIWNAIVSGFNGISSFFIGIVYMWPFILILVVLIYFIRKRFRKKLEK